MNLPPPPSPQSPIPTPDTHSFLENLVSVLILFLRSADCWGWHDRITGGGCGGEVPDEKWFRQGACTRLDSLPRITEQLSERTRTLISGLT